MGLFSFIKDSGDKLFHRNAAVLAPATPSAPAAAAAPAPAAEPSAQQISDMLYKRVMGLNLGLTDLGVSYNSATDTVDVRGKAKTQADRERAILALGNVQYVASVNDHITVETAAPESRMYTVQSGDTLSKIAKAMYGDANAYGRIFDANKPLLSDPDKIYPGQVLRIPA